MKIAFASEGKKLSSKLSKHFSRAKYYIFVNSEDKSVEKIKENPYKKSHNPGEIPEFIKQEKADVIISGNMGMKAINFFSKLGIIAITCDIKPINDSLKEYLNGKIKSANSCKEEK